MKIKMISLNEQGLENNDYRDFVIIKVNDKEVFSVGDGEPEDNNLGRNFCSVYSIPKLMELAFKAGKDGEAFDFEEVEVEER